MFMAAAIPYIMAAGTAVAAISAIQQGKAAKAAGQFNAKVAEQNAEFAQEQAKLQAQQADREGRLRLGAIRTAQGASGGRAAEGSVLDVLGDVAGQNELEKQDILYRGAVKASGYKSSAMLERAEGRQAVKSSYLKAGEALLSGGTKTYEAYARVNPPKRVK